MSQLGGYRCARKQSDHSQSTAATTTVGLITLGGQEERQHPCRNRAAQLGECGLKLSRLISTQGWQARMFASLTTLATGTGIVGKVTLTQRRLARPNQDDQTAFGV